MRVLCTRVLRKWLDLRPEIIQLLQFRNWPQSSATSPQRFPDPTRPETSPDRTSPYQARRPSQTFPSSLFSSRRHINHFCLLISFGFGFVCSSFLFRCFRFSFFVALLFFWQVCFVSFQNRFTNLYASGAGALICLVLCSTPSGPAAVAVASPSCCSCTCCSCCCLMSHIKMLRNK